jgi:hypothetical protein
MVSKAGDHGKKLSKYTSRKMLSIPEHTLAPNGPRIFFQPATCPWLSAMPIPCRGSWAYQLPLFWARDSAADMAPVLCQPHSFLPPEYRSGSAHVAIPNEDPLTRLASWPPMGPRGLSPIVLG